MTSSELIAAQTPLTYSRTACDGLCCTVEASVKVEKGRDTFCSIYCRTSLRGASAGNWDMLEDPSGRRNFSLDILLEDKGCGAGATLAAGAWLGAGASPLSKAARASFSARSAAICALINCNSKFLEVVFIH
ncbi:hypothetical protein E2C01_011110 [Portunus trituberculatus]|uniref:Uncharacterized protein n=1 Tax=Portunus trituberculatus TaxID=210409 RepID=A0A5B7DAE2_PORTR|nr:hypothetical protein [Portunus trituberculatus]